MGVLASALMGRRYVHSEKPELEEALEFAEAALRA